MDDPRYLGKFWVGGHDHYRSIFFVYHIAQPIIEILTCNFQDMILGVYPIHTNMGNIGVGGHDHYRSIFFV